MLCGVSICSCVCLLLYGIYCCRIVCGCSFFLLLFASVAAVAAVIQLNMIFFMCWHKQSNKYIPFNRIMTRIEMEMFNSEARTATILDNMSVKYRQTNETTDWLGLVDNRNNAHTTIFILTFIKKKE